jgi:PAS domain-containing protein
MSQQEIEVILSRHLAECLAMPIFIVNPEGDLIFYNEPAEAILGQSYTETGMIPAKEWGAIFQPFDSEGNPIALEDRPLMIALREHHPTHRRLSILDKDGVSREIEVTAFPLIGQAERFLGAIAIFWESPK